jgi:CubicO group peptidase (beta-lactamase class C family)
VGVIRDGVLIHEQGYGMADVEHAAPIGPDTVFDIASTSKQFTAAAIFLLLAEGKLSLSDDIHKYVSELPSYEEKSITLRHLLDHTSGVRDYVSLMNLAGWSLGDSLSAAKALEMLARQKALDFVPGESWAYSNSGYFLLSIVVARVSGMPFAEFVHNRIFQPLGMTRTRVRHDAKRIVASRAVGHRQCPGETWCIAESPWETTGDGGVLSTVSDLARWDNNFYEPRVGGSQLIERMHERGKLRSGEHTDYAGGLFIGSHRGLPTVTHGGGLPGFQSELLRFPSKRTSVITLCNANINAARLAQTIAGAVLREALEPAQASTPTPEANAKLSHTELDRWVARYRQPESGMLMEVSRAGDHLTIKRAGGNVHDLRAVDAKTFLFGPAPWPLRAEFDGAPGSRVVTVDQYGAWLEVKPSAPSSRSLLAYMGNYWSDELGVVWSVVSVNESLALRARNADGMLFPLRGDAFVSDGDGSTLEFVRDKRGRVTAFAVGSDLVFDRLQVSR